MSAQVSRASALSSTMLLVPHSLPDPDMPAWPVLAFQALGDLAEQVGGPTLAVFERPSERRRAELALSDVVDVELLAKRGQRVSAAGDGVVLADREIVAERSELLSSARVLVVVRLALPWPRPPWVPAPEGEDPSSFLRHDLPKAVDAFRAVVEPFLLAERDAPRLLMVLDPRLVDRPYGRWFLRTLTGLRRTRELDQAVAHLGGERGVTP